MYVWASWGNTASIRKLTRQESVKSVETTIGKGGPSLALPEDLPSFPRLDAVRKKDHGFIGLMGKVDSPSNTVSTHSVSVG